MEGYHDGVGCDGSAFVGSWVAVRSRRILIWRGLSRLSRGRGHSRPGGPTTTTPGRVFPATFRSSIGSGCGLRPDADEWIENLTETDSGPNDARGRPGHVPIEIVRCRRARRDIAQRLRWCSCSYGYHPARLPGSGRRRRRPCAETGSRTFKAVPERNSWSRAQGALMAAPQYSPRADPSRSRDTGHAPTSGVRGRDARPSSSTSWP